MINEHGIGKYLSRIHRLELKYLKPIFEQENIPTSCFSFILNIHHNPGISQKQLCEITQHDEAVATRLLKSMEKEGFVLKQRNPQDLRAFQLYLTDKGEVLYPAVKEALAHWWDYLLEDVPAEALQKNLEIMTERAIDLSQEKERKKHG